MLLMFGAVAPGQAASFILPPEDQRVVGRVAEVPVRDKETLLDIARRHDLGYREIVLANPNVDPWLPARDTERVLLPTRYILPKAPREGIVLNLAEMRLYYYPQARPGEKARVVTYPVSIGRRDWETPLGTTRVAAKVKDPVWYPPESIRAEHATQGGPLPKRVAPGPSNPLGRFALDLELPGYLLHGTNTPYGIGMRVTHGCVRLYPRDIEALFQEVPVGTPVRIVNQSYKLGWHAGALYLEVHPDLEDQAPFDTRALARAVHDAALDRLGAAVKWAQIKHTARTPRGFPQLVADLGN